MLDSAAENQVPDNDAGLSADNLVPDDGAGFSSYLFYLTMLHRKINSLDQNGRFSLFSGSF